MARSSSRRAAGPSCTTPRWRRGPALLAAWQPRTHGRRPHLGRTHWRVVGRAAGHERTGASADAQRRNSQRHHGARDAPRPARLGIADRRRSPGHASSMRWRWPCPPRRRQRLLGRHGRAFRHLAERAHDARAGQAYYVRHANRRRRRRASLDARSHQLGLLRQQQARAIRGSRKAGSCTPRRPGRASISNSIQHDAAQQLLQAVRRLPSGRRLPIPSYLVRASVASRTRRATARPAVPHRRRNGRRRVWRLVHRTACRSGVRKWPQPCSLLAVDGRSGGAVARR